MLGFATSNLDFSNNKDKFEHVTHMQNAALCLPQIREIYKRLAFAAAVPITYFSQELFLVGIWMLFEWL